MEAKAIEIGYEGIGLYSPKRLPVGREVVIRMGLLNTEDVVAVERVTGTVKWCRARGFGFAAGIKFKDLNPDEHPRLVAFLEEAESFKEAMDPPDLSNPEEFRSD
jgi:hypothetical protein